MKIILTLLIAITLQGCESLDSITKSINQKLDIVSNNLCVQGHGSNKLCGKGTEYGSKKLQYQQEMAQKTYNEVIKIGTKVCEVNYLEYGYYNAGYTEKFENNKIQIRKSYDNKIIWDTPYNWFKCKS